MATDVRFVEINETGREMTPEERTIAGELMTRFIRIRIHNSYQVYKKEVAQFMLSNYSFVLLQVINSINEIE